MGINLLVAALVFYGVLFMLYGLRELGRREIDLSRFSHTMYHRSRENSDTPVQGAGQRLPWEKASPIVFLGGLATGIIVYSVTGVFWISLVSSVAGLLFPKLWLEFKVASQREELDRGMEQATETIATVLRSGGGLAEAFERAALDARQPLDGHLLETATRIRTGMPQAEAVERFSQKTPVKELNIVTVGLRLAALGMPIHLNEMFFEVQRNIRDRVAFNREIRVLVAENKISAWVVAAMPVFLLSFIRQMAPEMVEPLFTTPLGIAVFCFCACFIAVGIYMIMQIVKPRD